MTYITTNRGFRLVEFRDSHENDCSIQESSSALTPMLWLGCNAAIHTSVNGTPLCLSRMHLSQERVRELIPLLQYFVETGELPSNGGAA